jgi:hypothetical protein
MLDDRPDVEPPEQVRKLLNWMWGAMLALFVVSVIAGLSLA